MIVIQHLDATVEHLRQIEEIVKPDYQVQVVKSLDAVQDIERTEILFTYGKGITEDVLKQMPALKWIQLSATGFDHLPAAYVQEKNIKVTTVKGSHVIPIAEYAFSCMLYFTRKMEHFFHLQGEKRWDRTVFSGELYGKNLVILGTGNIGQEIARKAKAFDMHSIGLNRRGQAEIYFDELYPIQQLEEVLPRADFLILALPYTKETYKMIGARELALLPGQAVLINLGRGELMDEEAAHQLLAEGRIQGMALDVFHQEPLPVSSPLWDTPQTIITPHMAAKTDRYLDRCIDVFAENCRLLIQGKPLINIAQFSRGY